MRDAGNISQGYDMEKMIAGLKREGGPFAVFGGEALTMPLDDLVQIFEFGYKTYGSNGVQTNGTLITEEHLDVFQKYKVHVGLSIDGPDELNDSRWVKDLPTTREATAKSHAALQALVKRKQSPSIIVTLYRGNAVGQRLDRLITWFKELDRMGVRNVRLHLLEVENREVAETMAMTTEENITALMRLYEFQRKTKINFDLFGEIARLLQANDDAVTCTWNACDPYTTSAVRGVSGQGESSNCGRTNKEGINWQKANTPGFERQVALYNTPQEDLGCKGCRFFFACKGQCPGTAEGGDWRNRSEHCGIWMALFERIEGDMIGLGQQPVSRAEWLPKLERIMVDTWDSGRNITIREAMHRLNGSPCAETGDGGNRPHGDHWDAPEGASHSDGIWDVHGDKGTTVHGDSGREDNA
jgi:uncharacterized protein